MDNENREQFSDDKWRDRHWRERHRIERETERFEKYCLSLMFDMRWVEKIERYDLSVGDINEEKE
jgi:hypothetical protein